MRQTENEIKLKKILEYHRAMGIISNKKYKKEMEYIKKIQQERYERQKN